MISTKTEQMLKRIVRKVLWLGRGTATMMGVALMVAVVLGAATTALAAVPGDLFSLGEANFPDKQANVVVEEVYPAEASVHVAAYEEEPTNLAWSVTAIAIRATAP